MKHCHKCGAEQKKRPRGRPAVDERTKVLSFRLPESAFDKLDKSRKKDIKQIIIDELALESRQESRIQRKKERIHQHREDECLRRGWERKGDMLVRVKR